VTSAELVKEQRVAGKHEKNGKSGAGTENEKKDQSARDLHNVGQNREKRIGKEKLKVGNVRVEATGKIAPAKLVEKAGGKVKQTLHDTRSEREHDLVNGRVHDALAEERLGTDKKHQGARYAEKKPDAVGLTHRQRIDEAFLEHGQNISRSDRQQNTGEHPQVNPAPGTRRHQEKAQKLAKRRSGGFLRKLWIV